MYICSWRDVFIDKESGVDHYLWGVGSHKGYDDIVPFSKTLLDCSVSAKHEDFVIHEGHAYFITVKVYNIMYFIISVEFVTMPGYTFVDVDQY